MKCKLHGIECKELRSEVFGRLFIMNTCPECENQYLENEKKILRKEYEELNIQKMELKGIEPMYYESDFDNFSTETAEMVAAKKAVIELTENKTGKIVMIGKNGTGKTHLAIAALKRFKYSHIYSMFEIGAIIRASYSKKDSSELKVLNMFIDFDLLVIDELGRTKGSDSELNWLSYIIDKRHTRNKPIIIISNNHLKKDCPKDGNCNKCLENYIDTDMISRLVENGKIIKFTGKDFRRGKR